MADNNKKLLTFESKFDIVNNEGSDLVSRATSPGVEPNLLLTSFLGKMNVNFSIVTSFIKYQTIRFFLWAEPMVRLGGF